MGPVMAGDCTHAALKGKSERAWDSICWVGILSMCVGFF